MQCLQMITITPKVAKKRPTAVQLAWAKNRDYIRVPTPKPIQVPCGKCAFCLTNKRSSWMFRIHHEMRTQDHVGWFLTLTYDEKYVRRVDDGRLSLRFKDVQLFLKRIRKAKYYAKYICVGEYGGQTRRPHYHMLLWTDAPPNFLDAEWYYGRIHYGALTMASAMYTLKYIIQPKQSSDDGIEPTRAQFSKGLGLAYLSKAVYNYHTEDEDNPRMFTVIDGNTVSLPRYYRNKIFTKYQLRTQAELTREQFITDRANQMRHALSLEGVVGKSGTLLQRYARAKAYLRSLRVEECNRILKNTKHNLTL